MESRSVNEFIFIGTAIRYLQDTNAGNYELGTVWIDGNYESLRKWLSDNHLHVSWRAAEMQLGEPIQKMRKLEVDQKGKIKLTKELAKEISEGANRLRETIEAESLDFQAYVVTDKRYPVKSLLDDPQNLMTPGVYNSISTMAQVDFVQACRAIAFELPTAAAFHLLRGTEEVLRKYYCEIVKQKRVSPLLWGPMVAGLRKRKTNAPPAELLNNLDNLRVGFRNPTQHPDKIYDIHEAQDLLSLCIDVINRMVKHQGDLTGI
jgi:hypothetical protein